MPGDATTKHLVKRRQAGVARGSNNDDDNFDSDGGQPTTASRNGSSPYCPTQKLDFAPIPTDAEDSEDDDDRPLYEVEEITSVRLKGRTTELFVKWKGWDIEDGEWKTLKELRGCKKLVRKFANNQEHSRHATGNRCIKVIHRWLDKENRRQASWRRYTLSAEEYKSAVMSTAASAIRRGDNPEDMLTRYSERVRGKRGEMGLQGYGKAEAVYCYGHGPGKHVWLPARELTESCHQELNLSIW